MCFCTSKNVYMDQTCKHLCRLVTLLPVELQYEFAGWNLNASLVNKPSITHFRDGSTCAKPSTQTTDTKEIKSNYQLRIWVKLFSSSS